MSKDACAKYIHWQLDSEVGSGPDLKRRCRYRPEFSDHGAMLWTAADDYCGEGFVPRSRFDD